MITVQLSSSLSLSYMNPVGCTIVGAAKAGPVNKGLEQDRLVAIDNLDASL